MNKLTIIQLFNKIAIGVDIPKKIKVWGEIFEYHSDDYYSISSSAPLMTYFGTDYFRAELNTEIEILDEQSKIPKHIPNEDIQDLNRAICPENVKCIAHKVNEIINYLEHIEKENK